MQAKDSIAFLPAPCHIRAFLFFHPGNLGPLRQPTGGLGKSEVLHAHDKGEDITAGAATETIKQLFVRADGKRGRFFMMKGTKSG